MNKARVAEAARGIIQKRSAALLREKSLSSICASRSSAQPGITLFLILRLTRRKDGDTWTEQKSVNLFVSVKCVQPKSADSYEEHGAFCVDCYWG